MEDSTLNYIGERLWAGQVGNLLVISSFIFSLGSGIFYFLFSKDNQISWKKIGRSLFFLHGSSVLGIFSMLFYMLFNHFFEYQYVWQHSNKAMPMEYILSCFWEGQEGSFLLWTFWHVLIGIALIFKSGKFEGPVMTVISLVQVFLTSMILGIYFGETRIGSNPFLLLREHPEFMDLPFVKIPTYLSSLDGRGLNPLLQNYWMVIHPPTLFLGFALTLVPFAFAIAGAWKGSYNEWQVYALPWTFAGVMILGAGILMGGAWAYEALSFGGFWAWDPVENASLVPWLTLVGAGHVMIVNKNKGGSLYTTFFLSCISFILVLYSTFLTRSGILGDSSVHAFTDLGMQKQLLLYLLFFVFLMIAVTLKGESISKIYTLLSSIIFISVFAFDFYPSSSLVGWSFLSVGILFFGYYKYYPKDEKDDELWSREFWIFIRTLLLLLTAIIITVFTSTPIFNKILNRKGAPIPIESYNTWTIPFAVAIAIVIAIGQFFKYKKTEKSKFLKNISISLFLSLGLGIFFSMALYFFKGYELATENQRNFHIVYSFLLTTSLFGVFSNLDYWLRILKGKIKLAGASIAHIGFSLILLGALISTSKKITLSKNSSGKNVESLGKQFKNNKSILLTQGDTLSMGPYLVSYEGKEKKDINVFFHVSYFSKNKEGKLQKEFDLYPRVQLNERMGNAAEPDTKHYLEKDIYTHVTYADLETQNTAKNQTGYHEPENHILHIGDTLFASNSFVILDSLKTNLSQKEYQVNDTAITVTAILRCVDIQNKSFVGRPQYKLNKNQLQPVADSVPELGLLFNFWKINPENGTVEIMLQEKSTNQKDFIVMEAHLFPLINVLWAGCILMVIGTGIAIIQRIKISMR